MRQMKSWCIMRSLDRALEDDIFAVSRRTELAVLATRRGRTVTGRAGCKAQEPCRWGRWLRRGLGCYSSCGESELGALVSEVGRLKEHPDATSFASKDRDCGYFALVPPAPAVLEAAHFTMQHFSLRSDQDHDE